MERLYREEHWLEDAGNLVGSQEVAGGGRGEVPPPGTDERREFLHSLTTTILRELAREHLREDLPRECWGWGAFAVGGTADCQQCGKPSKTPLWFGETTAPTILCWRCALIAHLGECELWPTP